MTPQALDFIATIAYVAGFIVLLWALTSLIKVLVTRIQRDHHALTFADDWLTHRNPHALAERIAMAKARQETHR